jgi:homoserine kinase
MRTIQVFAPATIGNFILGFDVLGASLATADRALGDALTISDAQPAGYSAKGEFAYRLPEDKDNLIIKTADFFNHQLPHKPQKLHFELSKNLPIGSGLGSSSASIVATLIGLNHWYQAPFSKEQLVDWAAKIEGRNSGSVHYDNVAPCLLGGLQLINTDTSPVCQSIPFFDDLYFAICFPDIEITTRRAREILPQQISLQAAVQMQSRLAAFVSACFLGQKEKALSLMKDDVIAPYRQSLIANYREAEQAALTQGAITFAISGSGPTCFAICQCPETARQVAKQMLKWLKQGDHAFSCVARLDNKGAYIVSDSNELKR